MRDSSAAIGRRLLLAGLLLLLAGLCLWILQPFLIPMAWAVVLGYASWPLLQRLRRWLRGSHTTSALLMTVILGLAVIVPVLWIMALVQSELVSAYQSLRAYLAQGPHTLPSVITNIPWVGPQLQQLLDRYSADPATLTRQASEWALSWAGQLGSVLGRVGRNLVKLSLTLLTLFFVFRDGHVMAAQWQQVIARFFGERLDPYLVTAGKMTRAVVYGMLITSVAQGVIAGIGYAVVRLQAPVLLGALTAILSIVPAVGTAIVWVPLALWLMYSGEVWHGVVLLAWGALLVHPADNVLRPILISNAVRVPFLLVMFGALGGLDAFGLLGLFIGPVLLAVAVAIWREWTAPLAPPRAGRSG